MVSLSSKEIKTVLRIQPASSLFSAHKRDFPVTQSDQDVSRREPEKCRGNIIKGKISRSLCFRVLLILECILTH